MEQFQSAVVAMLAGSALAGFGYAWLARAHEDGPAPRAVGALTGDAAAQRTERPAIAVMPAQTLREAPPALPLVMVAFRGGLLTVKAHDAPLREVLAAITRSVGVRFAFSGDAAEPLSIDLGPRPAGEVISRLLDRSSYGYAFVEAARGAGRSGPAQVFLIKQAAAGDVSGQAAARRISAPPAMSAPAKPVEQPLPPDEAALRQQRAVDALFDACKIQGCDTS
jgi:hypothetical protein